jgi:hypothetical protein
MCPDKRFEHLTFNLQGFEQGFDLQFVRLISQNIVSKTRLEEYLVLNQTC